MDRVLLFLFTCATALTIYSCGDNDDMDDMMMPDESVNITTQIVGNYTGTSEFGESGSSLTEEDRTATVTMESDSVISVKVGTFFGDPITFDGKLSSETQFSTDDASVLGESSYTGTGMLSGDTLFIDLSSGNQYYEFEGIRQ